VKGTASCEGELKAKCEVQCKEPEGALFCDGQYIDRGNNAKKCIDALNAVLTANVDVSASGSSEGECSGNTCEGSAEGKAEASCATVPGGPAGAGLALFGMVLAGAALARRRNG
jgi:MYXO-CTERM domain-containing protein